MSPAERTTFLGGLMTRRCHLSLPGAARSCNMHSASSNGHLPKFRGLRPEREKQERGTTRDDQKRMTCTLKLAPVNGAYSSVISCMTQASASFVACAMASTAHRCMPRRTIAPCHCHGAHCTHQRYSRQRMHDHNCSCASRLTSAAWPAGWSN